MDRPSDQLLTSAGFSQDKHGRVCRRYFLHVLQDVLQGSALADNFAEIVLPADLALKIKPLFLQSFARFSDLAMPQGIFDCDSDLVGDLPKQFNVLLRESILPEASEVQDADNCAAAGKRQGATGL